MIPVPVSFSDRRPVHVKSMKDYRRLADPGRYRNTPEMKLVDRIRKLEERVRGLEMMIINTRAKVLTKK